MLPFPCVQAMQHTTTTLHAVDTSALQDAVMSTAPVLADIGASPAVHEAASHAAAYATNATAATLQALTVWTMDRLTVLQVGIGWLHPCSWCMCARTS